MSTPHIELWQAEWCPSSRRVRQRLTELGLSFIAHQVPADREQRLELQRISTPARIPVIRVDGQTVAEADQILAFLDANFPEPAGAAAHRAKLNEKESEFCASCAAAAAEPAGAAVGA